MATTPTWNVGNDPSGTRETMALSVLIIFMLIAALSVVLHLMGHRKTGGGRLWWDDWLLIATLVFSYAVNIVFLVSLRYGGAGHTAGLSLVDKQTWYKLLLIFNCFSSIALPCFKFSLLFLYWRLFPKKWFRVTCVVVGVILLFNSAVAIFFFIFQCKPVAYFWNRTIAGGTCLNTKDLLISFSTVNMVGALVTSILATMIIWGLQISRRKQWMLSFIFLVNLPIIAISIARLDTYRTIGPGEDGTDTVWLYYWPCLYTSIEASLGVMAGAVPGMAPLFRDDPMTLPSYSTTPTPSTSMKTVSNPFAKGGIYTTTSVSVSRQEWRHGSSGSNNMGSGNNSNEKLPDAPVLMWSTWDKPGARIEEAGADDISATTPLRPQSSHHPERRSESRARSRSRAATVRSESRMARETFLESACSMRPESRGDCYADTPASRRMMSPTPPPKKLVRKSSQQWMNGGEDPVPTS